MIIEQINPYLYASLFKSPIKSIKEVGKDSTYRKVEKIHTSNNTMTLGRHFDVKV